jgi:hypothetical protein
MYPNTILTGWQLALMIVVPLASLIIWLTAVFLAARRPRDHAHEVSVAPDLTIRDDQERHDKLAA